MPRPTPAVLSEKFRPAVFEDPAPSFPPPLPQRRGLTVHGPSRPTSAAQRAAFPASACCLPCPPALKSPCACGPHQAQAKASSRRRRSSANQKRRGLSERMCVDYPTPSPARGCCFSATPLPFGSLLSLIACPPCRCAPVCSPPDCLFALSPRLLSSRPPRFARPSAFAAPAPNSPPPLCLYWSCRSPLLLPSRAAPPK